MKSLKVKHSIKNTGHTVLAGIFILQFLNASKTTAQNENYLGPHPNIGNVTSIQSLSNLNIVTAGKIQNINIPDNGPGPNGGSVTKPFVPQTTRNLIAENNAVSPLKKPKPIINKAQPKHVINQKTPLTPVSKTKPKSTIQRASVTFKKQPATTPVAVQTKTPKIKSPAVSIQSTPPPQASVAGKIAAEQPLEIVSDNTTANFPYLQNVAAIPQAQVNTLFASAPNPTHIKSESISEGSGKKSGNTMRNNKRHSRNHFLYVANKKLSKLFARNGKIKIDPAKCFTWR